MSKDAKEKARQYDRRFLAALALRVGVEEIVSLREMGQGEVRVTLRDGRKMILNARRLSDAAYNQRLRDEAREKRRPLGGG